MRHSQWVRTMQFVTPRLFARRSGEPPALPHSALVLGTMLIGVLWAGVALKYIDDCEADLVEAKRSLTNFNLLFEENVLRTIGEMDKEIRFARQLIEARTTADDVGAIIKAKTFPRDLVFQLAFIDAKGLLRASSLGPQALVATDLSDREHYRFHLGKTTDELYISKPVVGRVSAKVSIQLTRRVLRPDGTFDGVVVASFDPSHFENFYQRIDLGDEATFSLIGLDGVVRAAGGNSAQRYPVGDDLSTLPIMTRVREDASDAIFMFDETRQSRRMLAARRVAGLPLAVSVSLPESFVFTDTRTHLRTSVAIALVLSVLTLIVTWSAHVSERNARKTAKQLKLTLEHMTQGIMMVTKDLSVPVINARCVEMMGLPAGFSIAPPKFDDIIQHQRLSGEFANSLVPDGLEPIDAYGRIKQVAPHACYERQRPNGKFIEVRTTLLPDGGFVRTFADITQRRSAQQRATRLAAEDALTGLANRRTLITELERLTQHSAQAEWQSSFAVLFLDLDRFKVINDTKGHSVGDEVLKQVAARLRSSVRDSDMVARLGGDEFALLLEGASNDRVPEVVARRVIDSFARPFEVDGVAMSVGVSIGIAIAPKDGTVAAELLAAADTALYAAKAAGRNGYRRYKIEMMDELRHRQRLENDLRDALAANAIKLHYQPIVDLARGEFCGFEALARWTHPTLGAIPPDKFIAIAEDAGLIGSLGHKLLAKACHQAMSWPPHFSIAVNLSPLQFADHGLAESVELALAASGLAPQRLELEITESVLMRDTPQTIETLHRLKKIGVGIAMDDFGKGYSSLSYLQLFQFDRIKVDRSFVSKLGDADDLRACAIVEAVADIAAAFKIDTVAEGVETKQQAIRLQALGYHRAQGYFYSRPVPAEETCDLLSRREALARLSA